MRKCLKFNKRVFLSFFGVFVFFAIGKGFNLNDNNLKPDFSNVEENVGLLYNSDCDTSIISQIVSGVWGNDSTQMVYCINNNIEIKKDSTLEIKPGTILRFAAGTSFIINGSLIANGTKENQIYFESEMTGTPTWDGIYFNELSEVPLLSFCNFSNIDNDNYGALNFISCTYQEELNISNNNFYNNNCGAIFLQSVRNNDNNLNLNSNLINSNYFGIKITGGKYKNIIISNDTIENDFTIGAVFNGIYIDGVVTDKVKIHYTEINGSIGKLDENIFQSYSGAGIYIAGSSQGKINEGVQNIELLGNKVYSTISEHSAIYIHCKSKIDVDSCVVYGNSGFLGGLYATCEKLSVKNSSITNNGDSKNKLGGGINFEQLTEMSELFFENVVFQRNVIDSIGGGALRIHGGMKKAAFIIINDCQFMDNSSPKNGGGAVLIESYSEIGDITMNRNKFENNTSLFDGGAILLKKIDKINEFSCINSTKIAGNRSGNEFGNYSGGFLSIGSIKAVNNLYYQNNSHGISQNRASLNGGILSVNIDTLGGLFITGNDSISSQSSNGSGGFLYYSGNSIANVNFENNKGISTVSGEKGGAVFIESSSVIQNFISGQNNFDSVQSYSSGGFMHLAAKSILNIKVDSDKIGVARNDGNDSATGGSYNILCSDSLGKFLFANNFITQSSSGGNGGCIYLFTNNCSDEILISNNNIESASSNKSGGFIYIDSDDTITSKFKFIGNSINESYAKEDGGIIGFKDDIFITDSIIVKNNPFISGTANEGYGGFMHFNGVVNESFIIEDNINPLSFYSGDNGGGFNIINNTSNAVKYSVKNNNISSTTSKNGNGGFIYLKTDSVSVFDFYKNNIEVEAKSNKSGGLIYFEFLKSNYIFIKENTINSSISENGNGGVFCLIGDSQFEDATIIESLEVSNNKFKKSFIAKQDGGIGFVLTHNINNCQVDENLLGGYTGESKLMAKNGGFMAIHANFPFNGYPFVVNKNTFNVEEVDVSNSGGIIYVNGKLDQNFKFIENIVDAEISVGNNGGVVFIHNIDGVNELILFNGNKIKNKINAGNGGVVHIEGGYRNSNFSFLNDSVNVDLINVKSLGGVINITNVSSDNSEDKNHQNINISGNTINNIKAGLTGGVVSFQGVLDSTFNFTNNKITNIEANDAATLIGGVISFQDTVSKKRLDSFTILNNEINSINVLDGKSSVVDFMSTGIDNLNIVDNVIGINSDSEYSIISEEFGVFHFEIDTISIIVDSSNVYAGVTGGNGSILSVQGNDVSAIGDITVIADSLSLINSSGSGAGYFLDVSSIENFKIESVVINSVKAEENGGFITARKNVKINNLLFSKNMAINSSASGSGGLVYLISNLNNVQIDKSEFTNIYAGDKGGVFYLTGTQHDTINNLVISDCIFENNMGVKTGSEGGGIYAEKVKEGLIKNCFFDSIMANRDGGALNLFKFDKVVLGNNIAVFNESITKNGGFLAISNVDTFKSINNKYNSNFAKRGQGGAMYMSDTYFVSMHDSVLYCSAHQGAGIYLNNSSGDIDSSCFNNNYCFGENSVLDYDNYGGAIYAGSSSILDSFSISNSQFVNNTAGDGIAIYFKNIKARLERNMFIRNKTINGFNNAGCIKQYDSEVHYYNNGFLPGKKGSDDIKISSVCLSIRVDNIERVLNSKIVNCDFRSSDQFFITLSGLPGFKDSLNIINSIFSEGIARNIPGGNFYFNFNGHDNNVNIDYTCLEGVADIFNFDSSISDNPRYISNDNFCLEEISPCINTGNPMGEYNDNDGTINDMGIMGGPFAFRNCDDTYFGDLVRCNTEIDEFEKLEFLIYPNPASEKVYINVGEYIPGDSSIKIYSFTGQLLRQLIIPNSELHNTVSIDVSDFNSGTYLFRLRNKKNLYTSKLIIFK